MKAKEFILENNKLEPTKPRNFVAKNAMKTTSGAGAHKDKKRAEKQGNVKHKNKFNYKQAVAEGESFRDKKSLEQRLYNYEAAVNRATEATRVIKNADMHMEIIGEILELAKKTGIEETEFKYQIQEVYNAVSNLQGEVYKLVEPFTDAVQVVQNAIDELDEEEWQRKDQESNNEDIFSEVYRPVSDKEQEVLPDTVHGYWIVLRYFKLKKLWAARAEHARDGKVFDYVGRGKTKEEAADDLLKNLKQRIGNIEGKVKASGRASVDFNVEFSRDILRGSSEPFYAKIIAGPKLVIGSEEFEPELLLSDGFKKSGIRNTNAPEGSIPLPVISISAGQTARAELIENGRYYVGKETIDDDGHRVFPLEFDSVVSDKNDRIRLGRPGLTIGTERTVQK
jgi:hypothetical protein